MNTSESFTKPLEMNDLPCTQEFDRVGNLRNITYYPEDIVVSRAGFLFGSEVFKQIRDRIPFTLEFACIKRNTARRLRPYSGAVLRLLFHLS